MPDEIKLPPPSGDSQRAEGYVARLIPLISERKLRVTHTDLSKFDPSSLHDHYSLDLGDYQIEVSHTKQPTTGRDAYVILFNNLKNITEDSAQKEILAYLTLNEDQFKRIKDVAEEQIETLKKIEEEERFKTAMSGVDKLIEQISKGEIDLTKKPQKVPELPDEEKLESKTAPEPKQNLEKPSVPDFEPQAATQKNNLPGIEARGKPESKEEEQEPHPAVISASPTMPSSAPITPAATPERSRPISPLEAAAAIPILEEIDEPAPAPASPAPTQPVVEPPPSPVPLDQKATPSLQTPFEAQASASSASQPPPAKNPSIEDVQKALQQAYQQAPAAAYPAEYRPNMGSFPTDVASQDTPIDTTAQETLIQPNQDTSLPPNPQIDQAIDQAFKPAGNAVLDPKLQIDV